VTVNPWFWPMVIFLLGIAVVVVLILLFPTM
jgi:hypothetical protein